jgi:hypothetical protein
MKIFNKKFKLFFLKTYLIKKLNILFFLKKYFIYLLKFNFLKKINLQKLRIGIFLNKIYYRIDFILI